MTPTTWLVLLVVAACACVQVSAQAQTAPSPATLKLARTDTPPAIDGDLTDACWKGSAAFGGFVSTTGFWCREQTEGFLTYDDTHLYVAVRCHDSEIASVTAQNRPRDDESIAADDCVEIYVGVNHDLNTFYRLMINSLGNIYEAICDRRGSVRDTSWNPDCKVAVATGRNEWTIELAIPLADLGTAVPQPGTIWGFNLARRRPRTEEFGSWSMAGSFGAPAQFGDLVFDAIDPISSAFLFARDARGRLVLRTTVRNHATTPRQLRVQALPASPAQPGRKVSLAPLEEKQIDLPVRVRADDLLTDRTVTVRIADAKDQRIYLQKTGLLETTSLITLAPDRYYYPADCDSIAARVTARIGTSLRVSIRRTAQGDVLVEKTYPFPPDRNDCNVAIPAGDLAVGRYVITATALGADANQELSAHRVIHKVHLPAQGQIPSPMESISFRGDGVFLTNGKPVCPFFSTFPPVAPPSFAKNAFNVNWGDIEMTHGALRRVFAAPHHWVLDKGPVFSALGEDDAVRKRLRELVAKELADPQIFDWLVSYEAGIPMYRDSEKRIPLNNPQELRKISDFIKSIDPNHPTTVQIDDLTLVHLYKDCADVLAVASWGSSYIDSLIPNLVADVKSIRRAAGPAKPVMFYIGSSMPHETRRTAEEIRCASYLALMHDMNGLVFHVGHEGIAPTSTRHWSVYPGLAREIEFIYPILISPRSSNLPTVTANDRNLDFRVGRHDGKTYLIVCNTAGAPINPTFKFTGGEGCTHVALPLERRRIPLTNGGFTDEFMPYEAHVYEMVAESAPSRS